MDVTNVVIWIGLIIFHIMSIYAMESFSDLLCKDLFGLNFDRWGGGFRIFTGLVNLLGMLILKNSDKIYRGALFSSFCVLSALGGFRYLQDIDFGLLPKMLIYFILSLASIGGYWIKKKYVKD
jgi:hypothetical protein